MQKSKKVRMPAGIRNKLMAAVAMLLVSSIMMVSSTYAWFTLSTAPEVTGITTSVGANGNLEIALLNSTTFADMTQIKSAVGDSSAVKNVAEANITWGNLVDLSAASYGLNGIALMPAALNASYTDSTDASGTAIKVLSSVNSANPLMIAEYGADGRVSTINGQTVSAVASSTGAFAFDDTQTYGVRAIGTTSNLSVREIALRNAKSTVNTTKESAKASSTAAISANMSVLITFAAGDEVTAYTTEELASFRAIANAVVADLATLENGYKSAAVAKAAVSTDNDTEFAAAKALIDSMTLTQLAEKASDYDLNATAMNSLITAQTNAASAKNTLDGATTETPVANVEAAVKLLVDTVTKDGTTVYIAGGAIGELGNQLSTFLLASAGSIGAAYAGAKGVTTGTYLTLANTVATMNITSGESTASNITDTYGYIIDFAFRTNAAGSNLQLQTSAVNRVYTDQTATELATQGAGSTVTYAFTSGMTEDQVNALLGAIRLVFMNTANGTVYATGGLTDIDATTNPATAKVKLTGQTDSVGTITALAQNVPTAVSVLVYLDGNEVDNADVPNAASSGMLNLNLQFSSSAELVPMQNTTLQTMTAYTVTFNANGGTGIMTAARVSGDSYVVPTTANFTAPTGMKFKGWATTSNATEVISEPLALTADTTLYAIWEANSTSGDDTGSNSGTTEENGTEQNGNEQATTYTVHASSGTGYTITAPASAAEGATVTLTVTADEDYTVSSVTCTSRSGSTTHDVTAGDNGTYTFLMPAEDVEITVSVNDPTQTEQT